MPHVSLNSFPSLTYTMKLTIFVPQLHCVHRDPKPTLPFYPHPSRVMHPLLYSTNPWVTHLANDFTRKKSTNL